jgi:hypothetical protein
VDGIALLLAISCFTTALFTAMLVICAGPFREYTGLPLELRQITISLGLVTMSALPGGLALLVARRGRSGSRASVAASAFRFAAWGLRIDGVVTVFLVYLLLGG